MKAAKDNAVESAGRSRRPSRIRRLVFLLVMLALVYVALELSAFMAYRIVAGESFSFASMAERRAKILATTEERALAELEKNLQSPYPKQALHPFVGYVLDPDEYPRGVHDYGFRGELPSFDHSRQPGVRDSISIAITGGSVAQGLANSREGRRAMVEQLQAIERFRGKKMRFHTCSVSAYKQPQQLMTINYFLSMDAHFDIIINLDGFNEVALPAITNVKRGTFPFYPRLWETRISSVPDADLVQEVGHLVYLDGERRHMARRAGSARYSVLGSVCWYLWDRHLKSEIDEERARTTEGIVTSKSRRSDYSATGPEHEYATPEEMYRDFAAHWARASLLIHRLALGSGIPYFHFLQPSQYLPDTKIFGDEEREIAFEKKPRYRPHVLKGYPHLLEAGRRLTKQGVAFTSLTTIFAKNSEVVYKDACCHFNKRGNELLGREIGAAIVRQMKRR